MLTGIEPRPIANPTIKNITDATDNILKKTTAKSTCAIKIIEIDKIVNERKQIISLINNKILLPAFSTR